MKPEDFDSYWQQVEQELACVAQAPECTEMPLRATPEGKVFGLRLTSLGGYRIFAYYCVPHGEGPFPVIYRLPDYGSVVHIPPFEERCKHIAVALCHRGQRLSDQPFAASYPGLLTKGIESAHTYIYRGIAADCLRVIDFLLTREEVDKGRISLVGPLDRGHASSGGGVVLRSFALLQMLAESVCNHQLSARRIQ